MGWLDDEVALVTGGGSGLGRAVVDRFVAEGAQVGVLELSPTKAAELAADHGEAVVVTTGDATSLADNRRAVAEVLSAFGRLDVLVPNAGVWDFNTPLAGLPDEALDDAFDEVFHLNVKGYLLAAKAALEALRQSSGSIIFTVSSAGFWPGGGGALYTASKHAVTGLVKQLAYELAPEVRVNGVAPGGMATDLRGPRSLGLHGLSWGSLPVDGIIERLSPLGRGFAAEDYTGHYVLLASRENSRTVTGSIHNCDGGMGVRGCEEQGAVVASVLSGAHAPQGPAIGDVPGQPTRETT